MALNPRAVARALPAAGRANQSASPVTAGSTPLLATYDQWMIGQPGQGGYGPGLPRDLSAFVDSIAFGPMAPIQPVPINAPASGTGRAEPRRFDIRPGWNLPSGVPGEEGLKLASFAQLRTVADTYSIARSCIRVRIQEIMGLEWDIIPTAEAEKRMRGDHGARRDFVERRAKMLKFWRRPDPGKYHSFESWFHAVLEEVLVVDALSLYLQPSRRPGKGVLGSDTAALCLISGDTVRPLLDGLGNAPAPPNPAYQVYNYGVPRVDLMTAMTGDDVAEMGEALHREYRGDQLIYDPIFSRGWTPYGFPPLEQALIPALTGIQRQQYQLGYFSEGSVPGVFISAGDPNATPNQLRELQDALNAMAGDPSWKHKIIVLPQGSKIDPMRPIALADQFDEIIMTQMCMAFDVMPMELGIAPKVSSTQSTGAANQMAKASQDINVRKGLRPLLTRLKADVFNFMIQNVFGQHDMRWSWPKIERDDQDKERQTELIVNQVKIGLMSVDEGRMELGKQPWGLAVTSDPIYCMPTGFVPFGAVNPDTGAPDPLPAPGAPAGPTPAGVPATATPAGGQAKPAGNRATPAHTSAGSHTDTSEKPAHQAPGTRSAKAALRELELVGRSLGRGESLADWRREHIPAGVFATLAADAAVDIPTAITKARASLRVAELRERRDTAVEPIRQATARRLEELAEDVRADNTRGMITFVDEAVGALRDGMREGLRLGVRQAVADRAGRSPTTKAEEPARLGPLLDHLAARRAEEQRPFLHGMALAVFTRAARSWRGRSGAYADQVVNAYTEGYGLATLASTANPGDWLISWHITAPDACRPCKGRDGEVFTVATLPGWPGRGGYGDICEGGSHCRCVLTYQRATGGPVTVRDPAHEHVDLRRMQQQRLADVAAMREALN